MNIRKDRPNLKFERTPLPIPPNWIVAQESLMAYLTKSHQNKDASGKQLHSFCRSKGWDSKILGNAPLPEQPIRLGTWLIIPAHLDTNPMPERAMARIQTLFEEGFRPKGFFIVHEAPKQLPSKFEKMSAPVNETISPEFKAKLKGALKFTGKALGGIATVAGNLALGAVAIVVLLPVLALGAIAVIDPILVAVAEDNTWVEIDRWWN